MYKTNFLSKLRVCNTSNNNLIEVLWPLCIYSVYILTLVQVPNYITLKTVGGVAETWHFYAMCIRQIFWVNQGYVTLTIIIWSELFDLYAYAQSLRVYPSYGESFKLSITLKTVGGVEEIRTLLCHVYKTNFLSKSRVCNSINNDSISVLWPLCTCLVYILPWCKFQTITFKTVIATDMVLFSSEKCWYLSYFSTKAYVVGTH